ncbi:hypothetical protein [Streptomyces sp. 3N207]|uniref:hypothetical protein n=1 Tax=Streptomyces sp. 3N207 TaxID=3457417 RepID=UPI003FD27A3C
MTTSDTPPTSRFLVHHDYGMGGLWWWIRARSRREILERCAEVEVIDTPDQVAKADTWDLDEVDIDAPVMPAGLDELRAKRDAQRTRPGFGALAGREIVHLRRRGDYGDDDPAVYLMEVGSDGRRLRQVELAEDGTALRSGPDDWIFNPPVVDLFDPDLASMEISWEEFESQWRRARHDDSYA